MVSTRVNGSLKEDTVAGEAVKVTAVREILQLATPFIHQNSVVQTSVNLFILM